MGRNVVKRLDNLLEWWNNDGDAKVVTLDAEQRCMHVHITSRIIGSYLHMVAASGPNMYISLF